jgi:peptidoglycan/xylan/chitin deacetylase (PgdA/CDA1 family)
MLIHHLILTYTRALQVALKFVAIKIKLANPNQLRIVAYHDIPPEKEGAFFDQLKFLQEGWNIISPDIFEKMVTGKTPIKGRNLLFTFDDGFYSNYVIAEKYLNPMGVKAIFFVISDFVKIQDFSKARKFIAKNIMLSTDLDDIPKHCRNMQWQDLDTLLQQGHTIGCHTKSHARLSNITSSKELKYEILSCSSEILDNLDVKVRHFAYPFGDSSSFSKEACKIANNHFSFVYSGVRGENRENSKATIVFRDAAGSPIFSNKLLSVFLDGFIDFRYKKSRNKLEKWR